MAALMWHSEENKAISYFPETDISIIILSCDQCLFDYKASETVCNKDYWYFVILLWSSYQHALFRSAYTGAYVSMR